MMMQETITADLVEDGMFIPALGDGYVVEVDAAHDLRGDYNVAFAPNHILITFHDAQGDENYLLLHHDHPITVEYSTT